MPFIAKATARTDTGKSRVRKMRRNGDIPAVMYGHGDPSVLLVLNEHDFERFIEQLRGHSPLVELDVDGGMTRCVIKTIQRNPITGRLLHVDFQKVHAAEKITVNVPVLLHGAAVGVKEGGLLEHLLREIAVRATLDRIPEHFTIDISGLRMGQSVHLSALQAEGLEFVLPPDSTVVAVLAPRKLAAEPAKAEVAAEAAAAAEAKAAEAIPAAGDKK